MRRFTNVKSEKLKQLLGSLDPDWRAELDRILVDELSDAIDSVVDLRNSIAHGGSASVTYGRVTDYYVRIQRAIDQVANLCAPTSGRVVTAGWR